MTTLLKLEELGQFLLAIILFSQLDYAWWFFPALILLPDLSMVGYAINAKMGAWLYNVFHHKLIAIGVLTLGLYWRHEALYLAGIILFAHSALDRALGYGLKFSDSFAHTHLGQIGKAKEEAPPER